MSSLRKAVWVYHLSSAVIGIVLLVPFFYAGIKNGDFRSWFGAAFFILMYFPFLAASYGFLRFKKWAYFSVVCFYILEIVSISKIFEFKLSLFHYSIAFTLRGFQVGFDLISFGVLIFLFLLSKEYLAQSK